MDSGVVLRLQIEPGESFAGSVCTDGDVPALVFHGWIGFMAAVDQLRNTTADPTVSADARPQDSPARPAGRQPC